MGILIRGKICVVIATAVFAAGVFPSIAASASLCQKQEAVEDYAAPLGAMPPVPQAPITQQLPFAPPRVYLVRIGPGPLLTGDQRTGFSLSYSPPSLNGTEPSPPLDWQVEGRLASVDAAGNPLALLGEHRFDVDRLASSDAPSRPRLDLSFDTAGPGLYLSEIEISDKSGEQLARYGEYVRVLEPHMDAQLRLNRTTFKPGHRVVPRLENHGTMNLFFGLIGRSYQRHNGTRWVQAGFGNGPGPAIGLSMGPGGATACWPAQIPEQASPGRYRFALQLGFGRNRLFIREGQKTLFARFTITDDKLVFNDPIG